MKHVSKIITLAIGETRNEQSFSNIPGRVVGYATVQKGASSLPAAAFTGVSLIDGANYVLDNMDLNFCELTTNNSVPGKIAPVKIENPNDLIAVVSSTLAVTAAYYVRVIIFYEPITDTGNKISC